MTLYIVFEDVFGFDTDDRSFCHEVWDFISYPLIVIRKADVYRAIYDTEAWLKEQDEKARLMWGN